MDRPQAELPKTFRVKTDLYALILSGSGVESNGRSISRCRANADAWRAKLSVSETSGVAKVSLFTD